MKMKNRSLCSICLCIVIILCISGSSFALSTVRFDREFGGKGSGEGGFGKIISLAFDREGNISPLYLKDVEDENGKVKPRLVNVESEKVQLIYRHNLHYITKEDYRAAKKYVKDPEEYDFLKILKWDE